MIIKLAYDANALSMGISNALDSGRHDYANYLMSLKNHHDQFLAAVKGGNSDKVARARLGLETIRKTRPVRGSLPKLTAFRKLRLLL